MGPTRITVPDDRLAALRTELARRYPEMKVEPHPDAATIERWVIPSSKERSFGVRIVRPTTFPDEPPPATPADQSTLLVYIGGSILHAPRDPWQNPEAAALRAILLQFGELHHTHTDFNCPRCHQLIDKTVPRCPHCDWAILHENRPLDICFHRRLRRVGLFSTIGFALLGLILAAMNGFASARTMPWSFTIGALGSLGGVGAYLLAFSFAPPDYLASPLGERSVSPRDASSVLRRRRVTGIIMLCFALAAASCLAALALI